MNKKADPRTEFIIVRVSKTEREIMKKVAKDKGVSFSTFIRERLGLKEDNRY